MDIPKYLLIYFIYLCFILLLKMAKKSTVKNTKSNSPLSKKRKKLIALTDSWQAALSIISFVTLGFGIGFWAANLEKNDAIRQQDFECTKKIEAERKEWERERNNEIFLESISKAVSNTVKDSKNEIK